MGRQGAEADQSQSQVLTQLKGKHILITGTSGFLGKVVLEKLIRSVPEIGGVHLLIRGNRRNPDAHQRFLNEIASSSVFDRLKTENLEEFERFIAERVHCVIGEITAPQFGLSDGQFTALAERIDAIINSAASVNFREELDKALAINTLCLENICALSQAGSGLPVIQVSTCYVNGKNTGKALETVVRPAGASIPENPAGYFEIEELLSLLQNQIADVQERYTGRVLEKKLVDLGIREANHYGWSDTYTFTKWLGEQLLLKAMAGKSLTIVRPSIIESALKEPTPGWLEGIKVADAIIMAYAREKVTIFPGKRSGVIDVIPVDLVANSIILALAEALSKPGEHHIYQSCSGARNPVTLGEFIDHLLEEAKTNYAAYDYLFYRQPKKPFIAVNQRLFDMVIGGARLLLVLASWALKLVGRNRELAMLKNIDTTRSLATIFGFYTAPGYVFHNDRLLALSARFGPVDQGLFPVDPAAIDWSVYLRKIHLAGLNKYVLKERKRYRLKRRKMYKAA